MTTETIAPAEQETIDGKPNRAKYLGGSDVAAILGISPWKTPLQVYLDKVEPREEVITPEKAKLFRRGNRMEPYVIDLLREDTGFEIVGRGNRYKDPELPFIAAEIDCELRDKHGEVFNGEIKTVNPFKAKEWGEQQTDEIPLHYTAQVMHGLMVRPASACIMGVLIGGDDFRVYRVERDDETIEAIREKEIAFWKRVVERDPPDPTDVSDILRLYGTTATGAITATDEIQAAILDAKRLKADIKELQAGLDARENQIKLFMAAAEAITLRGKVIATWKEQTQRFFDAKAFEAANPTLFEKYRDIRNFRVLRLR